MTRLLLCRFEQNNDLCTIDKTTNFLSMEEAKVKKKKKEGLAKETINIIRTTQRNNIELTHIADNKANVLLSLNAIMLTFLIPNVVANTEFVLEKMLYIPLVILACTCFATIYISTIVLKPSSFDKFRDENNVEGNFSPFFFGNFYKMESKDFFEYMQDALADKQNIRVHLSQDMYYVGRRLGFKMLWVRRAFSLFLWGIFLSLASTALVLFL